MESRIILPIFFIVILTSGQEAPRNLTIESTNVAVETKLKNVSSLVLKPSYKEFNFTDCSESNLDECGNVIFLFGNPTLHLPQHRKQIKPFCRLVQSNKNIRLSVKL